MSANVPRIDAEVVRDPTPEAARRLARLRRIAWLMDRSIPVGRFRIGLDPIIGLVPGIGDWLGAAISTWVIYEAIRLGVPIPVLARMGLNVVVEAVVGAVPVLGDLFDATWQANMRNLRLVERHYDPSRRPRSLRWILAAFVIFAATLLVGVAVLILLVVRLVWGLFAGL
jgi:hypothetical protein